MDGTGLGRRAALVLGAGLLAGCAGSGLWPFGGGERRRAGARTAPGPVGPASALPPVADGTVLLPALRIAAADRGRQGVILHAEGIAPTQGFYAPQLRTVGRGADGIETVEIRAVPPPAAAPVGPEPTRLLVVGRFYPNRELEAIRGFRVVAAGNSILAAVP